MSVNNLSFPERLHQAQKDLYDIHALLLDPMKKLEKDTKRKKMAWKIMSGVEHTVGVTFGVLAAANVYNHSYFIGGCDIALATIGATAGFNAGNQADGYDDCINELHEMITKVQDIVDTSLPEQLNDIANIVRNSNQQQR